MESLSPAVLRKRITDVFSNGYLTLMAIIQGTALAAVFVALAPRLAGHAIFTQGLTAGTQAFAAILAVIIVTHEYLLLTVVVCWTPTIIDILVAFAVGSGEIWLALSIGTGESWWIALSTLSTAAVLAFFYTLRRTTESIFGGRNATYQRYRAVIRTQIALCLIMLAVTVYAALLASHHAYPTMLSIALIWLVIFAGAGIAALREYDQRRIYAEYGVPQIARTPGQR